MVLSTGDGHNGGQHGRQRQTERRDRLPGRRRHAAFTAGVLMELLQPRHAGRFELQH